ncbi:hypothetical protein MHIP_01900 [Mycolicibacterium hippocampi]|uniref:Uncharacterized protein n=1 Tax=Mycolicibacterium hippocampi TaxID=659824 RepID=A0A7I9ZG78_9MYCO|nr:hypothetical protein MHIP_01900 [Mycolicibacterium hippocampi]
MRTSRIASAHTQASAASIGSEFNAAAHHAKPGTASGVNNANIKGANNTGRQPRITCNAQQRQRRERRQDQQADRGTHQSRGTAG